MKKNFSKVFIVFLSIFMLFILTSQTADIIKMADEYYLKDNFQEAYNVLKKAYDSGNKDYEILWRLARATKNLVNKELETKDKKKAIAIYEEAQKYAEEANKVKPQNDMGHYWLAAVYGSIGMLKGVLNAVALMDPMEKEARLAIDYNKNFGDAYFLIANLYYKGRAALPFANKDNAYIIAFSFMYKAIELAESKAYETDILSLMYKDFIFFLTNRKYSLDKVVKMWEEAKKNFNNAKDPYEKMKYYYGSLPQPTKDDISLAKEIFEKLLALPELHRWDKEAKAEAKDMLK
jgi:tetratricopeptide (TPR) repeat protein